MDTTPREACERERFRDMRAFEHKAGHCSERRYFSMVEGYASRASGKGI